jgi:hypothetical protein
MVYMSANEKAVSLNQRASLRHGAAAHARAAAHESHAHGIHRGEALHVGIKSTHNP